MRIKRWTRGVAKGVTMAKIHQTRRGEGCRVDKMRRRENSEGVGEGDSRRIIKWKKRSRMFFWQREKEGKQRWEEENDSCPTTTWSSQQNGVISWRNYIASISFSLAPSVHPSNFQTTAYIECITTYVMLSSLTYMLQYVFLHLMHKFGN